jgi:NMD protein affecting ribosome stability and mRNA decay
MASKVECPRCGRLSASFVQGQCRGCYMRDYHHRRSAAADRQCPRCGGLSANFTQGVCQRCYMRDYQQRRSAAAVKNKQGSETPTPVADSDGRRLCVECKTPSVYARGLCLNCYMRDRQRLHRERFCVECGVQGVYSRGLCQNCFMRDRQRRHRERSCVECGATGTYARGLCQNCYLRDLRRQRRMKHRACVVCGVSFLSARRDALYCSPSCSQKAHRAGKAQLLQDEVQSAIATQDPTVAARIEVQARAVADLDRRKIDSTIEEAAKRGRTNAAPLAIDGQRKARQVRAGELWREASTLATLEAEQATFDTNGRQFEAEVAPIRHVAKPIGAYTDSEWAIRLLALMLLCCDPPAIAPDARGIGTKSNAERRGVAEGHA